MGLTYGKGNTVLATDPSSNYLNVYYKSRILRLNNYCDDDFVRDDDCSKIVADLRDDPKTLLSILMSFR